MTSCFYDKYETYLSDFSSSREAAAAFFDSLAIAICVKKQRYKLRFNKSNYQYNFRNLPERLIESFAPLAFLEEESWKGA